ncbi:hypothetical protein BDV38DRAFT_278960 [Aspergillus pseudotamarii]|uniref:N-acetyltransferase domain-containing protein n=1 Tax=Aspergillus pseudotamarii TaxID=132259 RepID=A0A5N6T5L2_ASPPS|nr:uncharacterized protein BDV38DRAFT_278960 [Aspergillus pseudotamarii]KAE8141607.1 hypothetical protein BDV38DRAFT_278960 [Aspergillus pseudotamarii]
MTAPNYTIRPVELSDIPALGDLLYTSKLALTINRLLFRNWPNEAVQRQNYLVIGHLALNRHRPVEKLEQSHGRTKTPDLPDFFAPEVATAVLEAVATIKEEVRTTDRYVVKSEYRHRGIGKNLMDYVFNKARSAGVPVVVNAEPQIYGFFKTYGFQDTKHVDFDLIQWAPPHSGFGIFRLAGLIWHP